MVSYREVDLMKKGVVIVNTARGGLLDSEAILKGIDTGKIATIGIDVCNNEYQSSQLPNDPLLKRSFSDNRVLITPHAGGSTLDAHSKVFGQVSKLIKHYISSIWNSWIKYQSMLEAGQITVVPDQ